MAYITGTITSANPGADLYAAMAPALTSAGFTLVDTVVISTRTHKIWKSAAANNAQGLDWYLDVCYTTTGAGNMWFFPMEFFDPATDLAYRMALSGLNNSALETTYYSAYGATGYSLEHANWFANASNATALALTTSTSSFGYWISVTGNRVVLLSSAAPTYLVYAGMFTPSTHHIAIAGSSAFPLVYARTSASGMSPMGGASTSAAGTSAALTRLPKATALSIGANWGAIPVLYASAALSELGPRIPDGSEFFVPRLASPIRVTGSDPTNGSPVLSSQAGTFGTLTDTVFLNASNAVARGDTITIDGATYVLTTYSGSSPTYALAFKAA